MSEILVLVGCGGKKMEKREYSWRIYESDYFKKRMTLAMLLGDPAILSSKHGFLPVTERIEPYNEDLREKENHEINSWALEVSNSIPDFYEDIVILAGKTYREPLKDILSEDGYKVYSPFEKDNIKGIGDQISWCKSGAKKIENGFNPKDFLVS